MVAAVVAMWKPSSGHPVHSPGATQLSPSVYSVNRDQAATYSAMPQADESLAVVECSTWRGSSIGRGRSCDPQDPSWRVFSTASQAPHTLYLTWYGCISWHGAGAIVPWEGYNFEYLATSRSLVVHCYKAAPYVYVPEHAYGIAAFPPAELYAIPDGSFGPGPIVVNEDDRLEHLVGDQTWDDFQVATATIA